MKLGYFTMPLHPPTRNYTETLKEDREAVVLADRLGYVEAFIGEHATDRAETITSCLAFIASLIDATKRIKLGSGTVNLPNSHPAAVAAQVSMIDHLLEGRFLFGISPGGLRSDAEVFGNLDGDRTAMFVEAIDMVLKIWSTEPPYRLEGKFWKVTTERTLDIEIGQGAIVKPYQRPHPPIVVTAVAPFSKGVTAAAERGWTPISANFLQPPWVASHWPKYLEGCKNAGRVADRRDWRVAKSIFVADDDAAARRYAKEEGSPYRSGGSFHASCASRSPPIVSRKAPPRVRAETQAAEAAPRPPAHCCGPRAGDPGGRHPLFRRGRLQRADAAAG